MTPTEWAMLIATVLGITSTLFMGLRWIVKSFLYELRPNGGSSIKGLYPSGTRYRMDSYQARLTSRQVLTLTTIQA